MKEIRTEIDIHATPQTVWAILTNVGAWPSWNPIVEQLHGQAKIGTKLSVTMVGKNQKSGPKYKPVITQLEQPKRFEWLAAMGFHFLFSNGKIIELEKSGNGTRLVHKETFSGALVPLFWSKMRDGVAPMLNKMNTALKEEAEKK